MAIHDRLAASTNTYRGYSLEEALAGIAAAGLVNVELSSVPGWVEHVPRDATAEDLDRVRGLLAQYRLNPISLSGHSDLVSDAGGVEFRKALDLCRALGIKLVTTSTGGHDAGSSGGLEEQRRAFLERIGPLLDDAAAGGIMICLETHGGLVATGEMVKALIDEIGHPNLGINYDPANVLFYADVQPEKDLPKAVDRVVHLHIKDKIGGKGVWNFPTIGTGEVGFDALFATLEVANFAGPCSIELEFQGTVLPLAEVNTALADSVTFLRQYIAG